MYPDNIHMFWILPSGLDMLLPQGTLDIFFPKELYVYCASLHLIALWAVESVLAPLRVLPRTDYKQGHTILADLHGNDRRSSLNPSLPTAKHQIRSSPPHRLLSRPKMAENGTSVEESEGNGNSDRFAASPEVDRGLPRANTMPGGRTECADKSEASLEKENLERSRTDKRRRNPHENPTAKLFSDQVPDKEKIRVLNRIATVKDDGTVVVDVPSNLETAHSELGSENRNGEAPDDEPFDLMDSQYRPPMQIVILIVGTRGDVQPFVAIGKCLQFLPWQFCELQWKLVISEHDEK